MISADEYPKNHISSVAASHYGALFQYELRARYRKLRW